MSTDSKVSSAKARFTNFSRRLRHNEKPAKLSPDMQRRGEASRAAVADASEPTSLPGASSSPPPPAVAHTSNVGVPAVNGNTSAAMSSSPATDASNAATMNNSTTTAAVGPSAPANGSPPAAVAAATIPSSSDSSAYEIRPPAHHRSASSLLHHPSADFKLPDLPWLCGTWHVTHSTLPMWRGKRNVRITYTRLPGDRLDDLVTYQEAGSTNLKKIAGVDAPKKDGSYLWRGKGWLKIATSNWEVLGWGGGGRHAGGSAAAAVAPAAASAPDASDSEQWVVTYFQKTMFTPAGIDIYSRSPGGLSERTLGKVMQALKQVDQAEAAGKTDFAKLVGELFPVTVDQGRTVKG